MKEGYEHIEEIIAKHLAGETDAEEASMLLAWKSESDENRQYFEQLQQVWDAAAQAKPQASRPIDTEAALKKLKTQIYTQTGATPRGRTISMGFWMRAAAALIVVAGAFFLLRPKARPLEIAANTESVLTDTLNDGSVVTLNRNSGLTVASAFNKKERRMKLRGEAYFEVTSNPERPFVVEVQELEIKVVGTAFNVDNTSNPDEVIVTVTHGKVLVHDQNQQIMLTAGEQAVYNRITHTLSRYSGAQNPNTLAYKNRVFQFDATPLGKVVKQLNTVYGVHIKLQNPVLENCPLTATYNNLALNRVLDLIATSFSLQIDHQPDGTIVIIGAGCGE
ncbi:MAG: FecR domain-containing protein [Bacteroidota bacterium]